MEGAKAPGDEARVLVVAPDDRLAGELCGGLDRLGWRTWTVRGPMGALAAAHPGLDAVIIDVSGGADPGLLALPDRLRALAAPRRLPVIALGRPEPALSRLGFDLALAPPVHPVQAALRLEVLVRAAAAEDEAELRAATFAARGRPLPPLAPDPAPMQILAVGEPAPKFLALRHALVAAGAEVVGAFTPFTAFDYLHERPFDAVVLWAGETHAEALSIVGGMKRNTKLFHIPTVLHLRTGAQVARSEAFHRGLSDIAAADTPPEETAQRILTLAQGHRRQSAIRARLEGARGSGLMDAATGLFTRDLFAAHLLRLSGVMRERKRPLAVAVLRIAMGPHLAQAKRGGWIDRAVPQVGSMIGRLVRAEDTAARLGSDVYALAMPGATASAARSAAERIAAVIACTAFEAGDGDAPFTLDFDLGVSSVEPNEPPAAALERAAARALVRRAG